MKEAALEAPEEFIRDANERLYQHVLGCRREWTVTGCRFGKRRRDPPVIMVREACLEMMQDMVREYRERFCMNEPT